MNELKKVRNLTKDGRYQLAIQELKDVLEKMDGCITTGRPMAMIGLQTKRLKPGYTGRSMKSLGF